MALPYTFRVENDPQFATLPYVKQQQIRFKTIYEDLQNTEPEFNELHPVQKQRIVTKLAKERPPVYQDKQFAQTAHELTQKIEQGDKQAMLIFLKNLQDRHGMKAGMLKAGSALISMKLADWFQANDIRTALGKYATSDFLTGTDADKFYAHASRNLFKDNPKVQEKFQKAVNTIRSTAGPLAFGADIAAMWGGSVAITGSKAVAGAVGKATEGIVAARTAGTMGRGAARVGLWAARTGIPASVDALFGGTYGVARQNLIALANDDPEAMTDSVREVGRAFGEFAAWDLALGMAIPTLFTFVGGAAKRIFKRGDDLIRKPLPEVERKALLRHFELGDMSDAQLNMLSDVGQDLYVQNRAIREIGEDIEEFRVRPLMAAHADAANNGMIIRQLDDGRVRLTKMNKKMVKNKPVVDYTQEVYDSLLSAKTEMSNHLARMKRLKWSAKEAAAFDNNLMNDRIRKLMITANNANEALDPMYKFGLNKADIDQIKKGRSKNYRSPVQRVGVTRAEAESLEINRGAIRVRVGEADEVAKRLKETPRRFLDPDKPAVLSTDTSKGGVEGIVPINTPASDEIYQYADQWARVAKQKEPTLRESHENLRALFLLENGFDSHIKKAPDGSVVGVETFLPNRVRLISDEAMPMLLEGKLDSVKAAKIVRAGNNISGIQQIPGGGIRGNETNLRKYFSKFTNKRWRKNFTRVLGTDQFEIWRSPYNTYKLEFPEAGVSREFDNLQQAKRFAQENWGDAGKVFREAENRGLTARIKNGIFEITTPDGKTMTAKDGEEVKKIFSEYSDAGAANEIFDEFEPNFTREFEDIILSYDQRVVPPGTMRTDLNAPNSMVYNDVNGGDVRLTFRQEAKRLFTQTDALVEDIAGTIDDPAFIGAQRNMERSLLVKQGQFHEGLEYVYNDIFTAIDTNGKTVKYWKPKYRDRRRMMYHYIAQGSDPVSADTYQRMAAELGELTEEEIRMAGRIREFYDSMAKRFGISHDKFVKDYMPRIRQFINDPSSYQRIVHQPMADGLMPDIWGSKNNIPGEVKAWFHEDRTSEFLQFFVEDDAMMSMIKYLDKGLAVEHVKPAWDELRVVLKNIGNDSLNDFMGRYAQKALNSFHTPGEDLVRKIGNSFFENINKRMAGKKGMLTKLVPKEGGNMLDILYTLNYMTNMAWRPWLAVRNSFQIFTTLAPRVGNDVVGEAVNLTHKQIRNGDNLIETLRQVGFLNRRPPIRGELGRTGTRLNRLSDKAFKMFKGSDDYTRLVAYNAGRIQLDRAFDQIRRGTLDLNTKGGKDVFLELSGLRKTDRFLGEELFEKTKKAFSSRVPNEDLLTSVEMTWGKKLIDDTMFVYDGAQSPMMFDGVVGKAFGRYGTYSVGYRANIWRGLKYGTAADKAGFIGRFITNQAALWATFGAMGIKASNFIPGQPAVFTGGPMFDLGITLIRSADTNSYQGRQARGELTRALGQLVPGTLQYSYLKKAMDYADTGDWWKAFLAITSTPTLRGPFLSR